MTPSSVAAWPDGSGALTVSASFYGSFAADSQGNADSARHLSRCLRRSASTPSRSPYSRARRRWVAELGLVDEQTAASFGALSQGGYDVETSRCCTAGEARRSAAMAIRHPVIE